FRGTGDIPRLAEAKALLKAPPSVPRETPAPRVVPTPETREIEQPTYATRSVEELRAFLPHLGLPEQSEAVIREFLNMPVIDELPKLRTVITDHITGGFQGVSFLDGIQRTIMTARDADPFTGPHELSHEIYQILPDELLAENQRMWMATVDAMIGQA